MAIIAVCLCVKGHRKGHAKLGVLLGPPSLFLCLSLSPFRCMVVFWAQLTLAVLKDHSGVIRPANINILLIITHALRQHADAVGDNDYHSAMLWPPAFSNLPFPTTPSEIYTQLWVLSQEVRAPCSSADNSHTVHGFVSSSLPTRVDGFTLYTSPSPFVGPLLGILNAMAKLKNKQINFKKPQKCNMAVMKPLLFSLIARVVMS